MKLQLHSSMTCNNCLKSSPIQRVSIAPKSGCGCNKSVGVSTACKPPELPLFKVVTPCCVPETNPLVFDLCASNDRTLEVLIFSHKAHVVNFSQDNISLTPAPTVYPAKVLVKCSGENDGCWVVNGNDPVTGIVPSSSCQAAAYHTIPRTYLELTIKPPVNSVCGTFSNQTTLVAETVYDLTSYVIKTPNPNLITDSSRIAESHSEFTVSEPVTSGTCDCFSVLPRQILIPGLVQGCSTVFYLPEIPDGIFTGFIHLAGTLIKEKVIIKNGL